MTCRASPTHIAVLIDKQDFFGPDPSVTNYDKLPQQICVCASCFEPHSNRSQWRALNSGHEFLMVFSNSQQNRPPRCQLCGKFLSYQIAQPQQQEVPR
jgi:PhoPQ-activated pathogenicity-related protein